MVRRLPKDFRKKLYYQYKKKFQIPGSAFGDILEETKDDDPSGFKRREGTDFDRRIAQQSDLPEVMAKCVQSTVAWPATMQTAKGVVTGGIGRAWRYFQDKRKKGRKKPDPPESAEEKVAGSKRAEESEK